MDSIMEDNALVLEAALLEGLDPDIYYDRLHMPGFLLRTNFSLLHWSVFYEASKCIEVK